MSDPFADAGPMPQLAERTAFPLKLRLYVMMFLQYFVQGAYLPVITEYLRSGLNFTPTEMGDFSAAIAIGPLIAPFFIGQIVDRHLATQYVLAFCHLVGGLIMFALFRIEELCAASGKLLSADVGIYWPIIVLGAVYSALYIPSMMLTNSLTFHHLKDRDREFPLIRLWGTIGFVVPAWLVEMYFLSGLKGDELDKARGVVLAVSGVSGLVMAGYSCTLPDTPPAPGDRKDIAPGKVLGLMRFRNFLVLVLVSFVVAIAHKYFFVWNSPYLKSILRLGGVEGAWEQRIASIGQIFEVVVMAFLGFSVKRYGFKATMLAGAAAYVVRCLIFAAAVSLDAPFAVMMTLIGIGQALHGFCFGCFLAAAYMYVDRVAPADVRGSMQNFYGAFVVGVGLVAGGIIGGWIGELFETLPGAETFRDTLGVETAAGLLPFERTIDGVDTELIADWPGIWLAGAVIAAIGLIGLWLFFPKEES